MLTCPECGGALTVDRRADIEVPTYCARQTPQVQLRRRPAVVAFCNDCEFTIEIISKGAES
jgi:uncharacterized protein YbaR (Trm112 family)